jgi:hypothetical protein
VSEGLKLRGCRYQAVASQGIEILINRIWWVLESLANLLHDATEKTLVQVNVIAKKLVRVLNINAVGRKRGLWKMF